MYNRTKLRITGRQHRELRRLLYPGDDKESVCLGLCGVGVCSGETERQRAVCLHHLHPVADKDCQVREGGLLIWSTAGIHTLIEHANRTHQVVLKVHSHPLGYEGFSILDDTADRELFTGIAGWLDTDFPGISAIMLPDGCLIARTVDGNGNFSSIESVSVAGPNIHIWHTDDVLLEDSIPEFAARTVQAFGKGTVQLLSRLTIGIVGVSGTGSPVTEMLFRLGAGKLVLVDGDIVEEKNVSRIINSTLADASRKRSKVQVIADAVKRSGLPTTVIPIPKNLFHPEVVRRVAQCDIVFGCMDSIDGRDLLNRLCTFYSIPYFDLGVHLKADGCGGVDQVCGTVHYLQPDGSTLLDRGVYTDDDLRAVGLLRTDPEAYRDQVRSKYIQGINEERPAVISVNILIASLAVNDLLARLHPFRADPNDSIASMTMNLVHSCIVTDTEIPSNSALAHNVGRGDTRPLLDMPSLSERTLAHA